ncbi:WG repeat-containing protein [Brumimicrobium salinarum]|uniref:WG repeat-containing protein n=1 Tax=Brumimicrobium salinarum TaxID=2058658 RepID=UPI0013FD1721|nr:WG repeat-containing protein [Brumimicrobium salinarum]
MKSDGRVISKLQAIQRTQLKRKTTMRLHFIILFFILFTKLSFGQDVITYEVNGKYGLKDSIGDILTPPMYDYIKYFSEGFAVIVIDYKYGYIAKNGKEIVHPKYDYVQDFQEGFAAVGIIRNNVGKYGFIDNTGNEVIPLKYDYVRSFWGNRAVVARQIYRTTFDEHAGKIKIIDYEYGVINSKGKKVTPLKYYELVGPFFNGETSVKKNGKWGLYDKNGKKILPIMYEAISTFPSKGLYGVKLNEKWGFVNAKNQVIIPFQFFYIDTEGGFNDGKINVSRHEWEKGYYIDENGKKIP